MIQTGSALPFRAPSWTTSTASVRPTGDSTIVCDTVQLGPPVTTSTQSPTGPLAANFASMYESCQTSTYTVAKTLVPVLFLSDLDGTWLSHDEKNLVKLNQSIGALKAEAELHGFQLMHGYITARPPQRVRQENLPTPDWTVTYNGAYIQPGLAPEDVELRMRSWEAINEKTRFDSAEVVRLAGKLVREPEFANLKLKTVGQAVGNPASDGCAYACGLCFENDSIALRDGETAAQLKPESFRAPGQLEDFQERMVELLRQRGMKATFSPIYSFQGKPLTMFNVNAAPADKGDAVNYLSKALKVDKKHLIVAGDGGNDISMMKNPRGEDDGRRVIVVGPNQDLRQSATGLEHAVLADPGQDCALGVLDGLRQHLDAIYADYPIQA